MPSDSERLSRRITYELTATRQPFAPASPVRIAKPNALFISIRGDISACLVVFCHSNDGVTTGSVLPVFLLDQEYQRPNGHASLTLRHEHHADRGDDALFRDERRRDRSSSFG